MLRATRWICGSLILAGWLGTAAVAPAQSKNDPPREVIDEAKLFKKDTIREANSEIAEIKRKYHKDVLIETRPEGVPNSEYREWARKRAKDYRVNGIYIIITLRPSEHLAVEVGNATERSGDFTEKNREAVQGLLIKGFKKKELDSTLLDALKYIRTAFRDNTAPKAGAAAPPPAGVPPEPGGQQEPAQRTGHGWGLFGMGIGGFICLALVAIVVIWVVIGLVRALTAPRYPVGGPGGGYGGGYGPGYGGYGGGGGGFFSSLLGGMFGAAAGMWMYNSFFGGHSYGGGPTTPTSSGFGDGGYYGGTANPNAEPQPNDVASGYSGDGGADWGPDKENADAGGGDGGGGDWGGDAGGGDAGGGDAGGGDAGGGGGDWGGGDGGGGGGDWGGGGGDWGGGGGGGDFGGGGGGDW